MEVVGKTIIKYAGKRYGKKAVISGFNSDELYYETVVTQSRFGKPKEKKVKKRMPPGLTPVEEALLKKTKKMAWRLDMSLINVAGIRFGWSSVIGIVPGFGDVIDILFAFKLYQTICTLPDPPLEGTTKRIMLLNILVDFVIGLVPFLGDLMDGVYKANTRNVAILEAELQKRGKARIGGRSEEIEPGVIVEHHTGPPPGYTSRAPEQPEPTHSASKSGGVRSWFGGRKEQDVESGRNIVMTQPARVERSYQRGNRY